MDADSQLLAIPQSVTEPQALLGAGTITAKAEVPMELTATVRQSIPMVVGLTLGEQRSTDPNRPSLILRRAGDKSLWDIAKSTGSTMDAIRRANNLTDEPAPSQMLLIPVK